jgi:hypothetical protein
MLVRLPGKKKVVQPCTNVYEVRSIQMEQTHGTKPEQTSKQLNISKKKTLFWTAYITEGKAVGMTVINEFARDVKATGHDLHLYGGLRKAKKNPDNPCFETGVSKIQSRGTNNWSVRWYI